MLEAVSRPAATIAVGTATALALDDEADVDEREGRVVPPPEADDMPEASRTRGIRKAQKTQRRHARETQSVS